MDAVELRDVTKTYGEHIAVDELFLSVPRGSVYGFIGPNGSGKTTTLRMIMNILVPDRGEIRVHGEELHGAATDRVGYMPEERGLYKKMKVRELLEFYGAIKNGSQVRTEAERWLERFGLTAWASKKVEALSKGMSQKVQFIATVVARPDPVILDEPFTGLDPVNADALREAILELCADGTTVILSTHDMAVAESMCDFIFMIFNGKKVLDGTLAAIQDEYGSDTIRVRTAGGGEALAGLDGVARITDFGQLQELQLDEGIDPQILLSQLVKRTRIHRFELTRPTLHDIFVRIAGPAPEEVQHA